MTDIIEKLTFQQLKDFCNSLTEEQLKFPVVSSGEADGFNILFAEIIDYDLYVNKDDNEDCGQIEDLRDIHGDDFDINNYLIAAHKGTPRLFHF